MDPYTVVLCWRFLSNLYIFTSYFYEAVVSSFLHIILVCGLIAPYEAYAVSFNKPCTLCSGCLLYYLYILYPSLVVIISLLPYTISLVVIMCLVNWCTKMASLIESERNAQSEYYSVLLQVMELVIWLLFLRFY